MNQEISHTLNLALKNIQDTKRGKKQLISLLFDACCVVFAFWLALSIRHSEYYTDLFKHWQILAVVVFATAAVFAGLGVYRAVLRYSGYRLQLQLYKGVFLSSLVVVLTDYILTGGTLPRSTFVVFGLVLLLLVSTTRGVWKSLIDENQVKLGERVAVFGAGQAGRQLVEVLRRSEKYNPVCFIDSKPALHGVDIDGLRVINPARLSVECRPRAYEFSRVLLAIPSASNQARQHIVQELSDIGLRVQSVPGLDELLMGKPLSTLRDVSPDDVLGRDAVAPKEDMMRECVGGKVVLVTGAGGSIGSEISRQLSRLGPSKLILLDNSEPSLYGLEQEFSSKGALEDGPAVVPVLGSVLNKELIQKILKQYKVQVVYHAAAYKHVPIVEAHPSSGARVNVLGTLNVADLSIAYGVERFVMVSTDKAVRPTNVMGATKRMAELLIQHRASTAAKTKLCMVRFGNVLGSSGSVVPKFLAQIDAGGPVTVTHPDVTRYFMTIPEASQLVIQAGAMAKGGEVYVLDMGEPKKITDLARQLVSLRGLTMLDDDNPSGDIELRFTGLRPGEKLYEELLIDGDNIESTEHHKISRATESTLSPDSVKLSIEQFKRACQEQQDNAVVNLLRTYVIEYAPAKHSNHQSL